MRYQENIGIDNYAPEDMTAKYC